MQIHVALRQSGWSRRTRDVTCCGFFVDLFYFFIFGIALSHRPQTDCDVYATYGVFLRRAMCLVDLVSATHHLRDLIHQQPQSGGVYRLSQT